MVYKVQTWNKVNPLKGVGERGGGQGLDKMQ
jgi:hypothetical protein